jgi:parallel beta-helix repeat protein
MSAPLATAQDAGSGSGGAGGNGPDGGIDAGDAGTDAGATADAGTTADAGATADAGPTGPPVFYVDARAGLDTNDGLSPASAFATLGRAAGAVRPGATVLVMSGTYTSDGSVNPLTISTSGTAEAWITFAAAPGHHPVIQLPRGPGASAGIHLPGAAFVVIDGFEVVGQNQSITAKEAAANDGSQAVLNENCVYIDGMGYGDFHPKVPHDIIIRNSSVHDCSAAGIEVNVADAITIEHDRIYNNGWWTVFGTSGLGLYHLTDVGGSTTRGRYKNLIAGNLVYNNRNNLPWRGGSPPGIYDGNGIIVDDSNHAQPAAGLYDVQGVPYTGRTYVSNNIVHDNGGRGIHVYSSAHVDLVNNTAWNDLLTSSPHIAFGEIDAEQSSDVVAVNNLAVNLSGKDVNGDNAAPYDYNLWDAARVPYAGAHDIVSPALLADPAHGQFAPGPGSPALRSGTSALAPADDVFGTPRPKSAVDRGAIQVSK